MSLYLCAGATALQYDLTIVSRNVSDFSVVGLAVLNPWDART
jgi:predicted nucleic acid-binding protein